MKRRQAESSSGWLGSIFGYGDDRRLVTAFVFALAIHEVLIGLIPPPAPPPPPDRFIVQKIALLARPTPTPQPTPPPVVKHILQTITPRVVNSGKSAAKEIVKHAGAAAPKIKTVYHSKPVWDIVGAHGSGAGKNGTYGSLGNGGTGTGQGTTGNGAGAGPCGVVDFINVGGPQYDKATHGFFVTIKMVVQYADGTSDDIVLDYPFYYPSDAADPWSDQNKNNPDFPTVFQFPPASKRAGEPAIVQYVMRHTDNGGFTMLTDCPSSAVPTP